MYIALSATPPAGIGEPRGPPFAVILYLNLRPATLEQQQFRLRAMKPIEVKMRDYCRTKLSAFEVSERIYVITDLPRTAKGSTDRRGKEPLSAARGGLKLQ